MLTLTTILEERKLEPPLLYGISARHTFPQLDPLDYLELLFQTRAHILQWREKDLERGENRPLVRRGAELAREKNKLFLVNSLTELALEEGADGVHLTADRDPAKARRRSQHLARDEFLVGKSVHSLREAKNVQSDGGDYVLLSPILQPISKESSRPPLGLPILRQAVQTLHIPVFALGGIKQTNLQAVFKTGAIGAAGISWLHREAAALL